MRPVADRAEVSIDFPEKTYMGSFGHTAAFSAHATSEAAELKLTHGGTAKRTVEFYLHWYFFADMLDEIAASLEGRTGLVDDAHRQAISDAAVRLAAALGGTAGPGAAEGKAAKPQG